MRKLTIAVLVAVVAVTAAACGGSDASPSSPTPTIPQVAGNYTGTAIITYPQLGGSVNATGTMTVTQSGSTVNLSSLVLHVPAVGTFSIPLGETTINTTGAISGSGLSATNVWDATCKAYESYSASGTFVGKQFQGSMITTFSSTAGGCYNFSMTVTLNRP
jgi:hypothetical protein